MSAEVEVRSGVFEVSKIQRLFGPLNMADRYLYDVSADGQKILAVVSPESKAAEQLTVLTNAIAGPKE